MAAAAAAAAAAALAAGAVTPTPPVGRAVTAATATIMEALERLFRRRRAELVEYVEAFVYEEMPDAPEDRVQALVREERAREAEFQRKAKRRLKAALPTVLREADPQVRAERLTSLLETEKRYLRQREQAAAQRAVAALEHDLVKSISPEGAYWQLSPLVREHTLDCLAMGGKFWPWAVLEKFHPPLHPNCPCRLLSLQEAEKQGLMTAADVPDPHDAAVRAKALMDEARRLEETLAPEELEEAVAELEALRLMEARDRKLLRWGKGLTAGGEFRPVRGGARPKVAKAALEKVAKLAQPPARTVTLRGQPHTVTAGEHFDARIDGVRFTSPVGGTNVYRNGVLVNDAHPDLAPNDQGALWDDLNGPDWLGPDVTGVAEPGSSHLDKPTPPPEPDVVLEPVGSARTGTAIPDYTGTQLTIKAKHAKAGGSTGAQFAFDTHGDRWLVKTYRGDRDRVATELLANAIYREMGAPAADAGTLRFKRAEPRFDRIKDVALDEPPLPKGKRISTGIIVREPDGSMWIYEPKGHFGGYEHTFPKGGLEKGLTPQQNAHKELWEETGLHAHITGFVGDFQGDTGVSRYYVAVRTGGEPHPDDPTPYVQGGSETAAVKRVSAEQAAQLLNRQRDKDVLAAALKVPLPEGPPPPDEFPEGDEVLALTYPLVDGEQRKIDTPSRALGEHYMTDALVANWDFVGLTDDNLLWNGDEPTRIDQGGTFQFRAQGQPKPYGPIPTEVWTMQSPKGQGFGKALVTESMMREQAAEIGRTLSDARIDQLVDAAPFADQQMREEVRQALKDRVQWMREFADGEQQLPTPLDGAKARQQLTVAQADLEVTPEEHAVLDWTLGGGIGAVNGHLRGGGTKDQASPAMQAAVKHLDSLLKWSRLEDDVYGYMPFDPAKFGDAQKLLGRTLSDKGYANATTRRSDVMDAPGVIRVTAPAGTRGLYTYGLEGAEDFPPGGPDLLFGRGARMKIVRAETGADGKTTLDAVIIP